MSDKRAGEQEGERVAGTTLYAVILADLIEWAGEDGDLEDIRSASRHLTPAVRAYVTDRAAALSRPSLTCNASAQA